MLNKFLKRFLSIGNHPTRSFEQNRSFPKKPSYQEVDIEAIKKESTKLKNEKGFNESITYLETYLSQNLSVDDKIKLIKKAIPYLKKAGVQEAKIDSFTHQYLQTYHESTLTFMNCISIGKFYAIAKNPQKALDFMRLAALKISPSKDDWDRFALYSEVLNLKAEICLNAYKNPKHYDYINIKLQETAIIMATDLARGYFGVHSYKDRVSAIKNDEPFDIFMDKNFRHSLAQISVSNDDIITLKNKYIHFLETTLVDLMCIEKEYYESQFLFTQKHGNIIQYEKDNLRNLANIGQIEESVNEILKSVIPPK